MDPVKRNTEPTSTDAAADRQERAVEKRTRRAGKREVETQRTDVPASPLQLMPGAIGSAIGYAFDCMGAAEDAIKLAGLSKEQGSVAFGAMCPSPILRGKVELYLAHAMELCARVKRGVRGPGLEPGTDAECLAAYSEQSLRAPLNRQGQACYEALFHKLFPKAARALQPEGPTPETWPGQVAEDVAQLRRKLTVKGRGEKVTP